MPNASDAAPLIVPDRDTARQMFAVLRQAGFLSERPLQLADVAEDQLGSGPRETRRIAVGLRRTAGQMSLDTLTRLFVIDVSVPVEAAAAALAPTPLDLWVRTGLLQFENGLARATLQLAPVQGLLFAADFRRAGPVRPDHVMGYCGSTETVARLTLRRPVQTVLDLGAGCGVHALLAARHAERVVATDLNPRASNLAAFNVRLNGIENVEVLTGDLFAPVKGQSFDLIIANPPFVISPDSGFIYRDSCRTGDELLREILHTVPQHLNEGGYCQLLCEWVHPRDEDWRDRLGGWTEGNGCDVWVLASSTFSAAQHAESWAGGDEAEAPGPCAERMARWVAYYEQLGIDAITEGLILLRRRSGGTNWFAVDQAPTFGGDVVRGLERGFALRTWLAEVDDETLLQSNLVVPPELRWQQTLAVDEGAWKPRDSRFSLREGAQFQLPHDPHLVPLFHACRTPTTAADALVVLQHAARDADPAQLLRLIRGLVARGFLVPAS